LAIPNITTTERKNLREKARAAVRDGRLRLGLTQAQVGLAAGLSQSEISRIEAGKVDPPIWWIMYLLHIFPDLLADQGDDLEQLRNAVHQHVESLDAVTLRRLLAVR